jgi:hypothetical protein
VDQPPFLEWEQMNMYWSRWKGHGYAGSVHLNTDRNVWEVSGETPDGRSLPGSGVFDAHRAPYPKVQAMVEELVRKDLEG